MVEWCICWCYQSINYTTNVQFMLDWSG